jgi:predicted DCC family thiol-disulfide oxidoreductase YuxK
MAESQSFPLIIFDGVCNLCNASVDFIVRHDQAARFRFTPNQGSTAQEVLPLHGKPSEEVGTLYLLEDGRLYDRSDAVLRIAKHLGFPWSLSVVFLIVPRFIRDGVYQWIARNRYRWFGKKETCRLPSPEERARFV